MISCHRLPGLSWDSMGCTGGDVLFFGADRPSLDIINDICIYVGPVLLWFRTPFSPSPDVHHGGQQGSG